MIFDITPDEGLGFGDVKQAALDVVTSSEHLVFCPGHFFLAGKVCTLSCR
jgi:hypothetical protein